MRDGLYTARGWQPLPFCEADYTTARGRRLSLLWGAVCFGVVMACMVISGLFRRQNFTGSVSM